MLLRGKSMSKKCTPMPHITDEENLTSQTYMDMFFRIQRIATNVVRWDGLPPNTNQLLIERYLFYFGMAAFFYDDILGKFVVLPVSVQTAWDENGFPTAYTVKGFMDYTRNLTTENSVLIFDNYELTPGMEAAQMFASRLTNALRTCDVHLEANKIGKILGVSEEQKKSIDTLIKKIRNFQLWIIGSKTMGKIADEIKPVDLQPTFILDRLDYHYTFLWNDVLAHYGVYGGSPKTGGVNTVEMISENSQADVNRLAIINPRQDAAEKINKMFGLQVSVGSNVNWYAGNGGGGIEGGVDNGKLHNDVKDDNGSVDGGEGSYYNAWN